MAKKVFRLYNIQGNDTLTHWQESTAYGTTAITQITDPDGADAKKQITSIPSPFARIDLVKTAFKEVANSGDLDGKTIYHRIVSDTFDVAEIFFNCERLKDKIEILAWDRKKDLDTDNMLGKTLYRYLESDSKLDDSGKEPYNFSRLKRIYLLNYIGPDHPAKLNIIGATSPATLFFSSANDLSYVSEHIAFGQDKPFDDSFQPLYKRDFEFQKYLYAFRKAYRGFHKDFPEVENYLFEGKSNNYQKLTQKQKNEIDALNAESINAYETIAIGAGGANTVEILDKPFHKKASITHFDSDFEIDSALVEGKKPLVLPIEAGNTYTKLKYTQDEWASTYKAPYYDPIPWQNRSLPQVHDTYPYLTISDFLTDTIVRMPYKINEGSFFDGNYKGDEDSFLLPLTDTFFKFFTVEQLKGEVKGKKMIELKTNAGGVTVILHIPIAKGCIEYRRTYFEGLPSNIEKNDGALIKNDDVVFALFPNIKFKTDNEAFYRFGLISDYNINDNYVVSFHSVNKQINAPCKTRNNSYSEYKKYNNYVLDKKTFDYVKIKYGNDTQGVIIPNFQKQKGTEQFTFAIDFGTTNTHIEYKVGNRSAKPFDILEDEKQIHLFAKDYERIEKYIFDFDFLPEKVGREEEFKFPMRTALSEAKNFDWREDAIPMAHANVAFPYEKRIEYKYNRIQTGLKWSTNEKNPEKVKCFIESLFLLLRNKVILGNGDLNNTKIIWFYPISMTRERFLKFEKEWEDAYVKYFINFDEDDFENDVKYNEALDKTLKENLIPMTESVAPYQYYKTTVSNASDMVSIDIGGGTSDIVIAVAEEVKYISSFRFAANSIFGDGYAANSINGILRQFKDDIYDVLKTANISTLTNIYAELNAKNNSSDIASFFFSLKNNKEVIERNITGNVDFNRMLQIDEKQKIIFVFFYAAIIYHLAHIMKAKGLKMPRHITFSGNGSKVIQILTTDNGLLQDYTKLIFEKVYGEQYHRNGLTILQNSTNPKEATCKGGISSPKAQDYNDMSKTKVVLKSADNQTFVTDEKYGSITSNKEEFLNKTVAEVQKFIQFVFNLNNEFSYKNNFGVSSDSFKIAKEECDRDLLIFSDKGLTQKLAEVSDDDIIEETFFFYPLNGMLNALSATITDNHK